MVKAYRVLSLFVCNIEGPACYSGLFFQCCPVMCGLWLPLNTLLGSPFLKCRAASFVQLQCVRDKGELMGWKTPVSTGQPPYGRVHSLLYPRSEPCFLLFFSHKYKSQWGTCPGTLVPWKTIYSIHIQHHIEYSFLRVNTTSWHVSLKCPTFWQGSTSSQYNIPSTPCLTNHINTSLETSINGISQFSRNIRMGYKTEVRKQSLEQTSPVRAW